MFEVFICNQGKQLCNVKYNLNYKWLLWQDSNKKDREMSRHNKFKLFGLRYFWLMQENKDTNNFLKLKLNQPQQMTLKLSQKSWSFNSVLKMSFQITNDRSIPFKNSVNQSNQIQQKNHTKLNEKWGKRSEQIHYFSQLYQNNYISNRRRASKGCKMKWEKKRVNPISTHRAEGKKITFWN